MQRVSGGHKNTHIQNYTLCDCWLYLWLEAMLGSASMKTQMQLKKTFEVGAESVILVLILSVCLFVFKIVV